MGKLAEIPIEQQIEELKAAGWKAMRPSWIWKSPSGALWLGPHGAWKAAFEGDADEKD